jgi:hypothetical protein
MDEDLAYIQCPGVASRRGGKVMALHNPVSDLRLLEGDLRFDIDGRIGHREPVKLDSSCTS